MDKLWTLVHHTGMPVIPFDCNPKSKDDGMLVYRSRQAALAASKHQNRMYGLDCRPERLSVYMERTKGGAS